MMTLNFFKIRGGDTKEEQAKSLAFEFCINARQTARKP
jgi:hypothetical protein